MSERTPQPTPPKPPRSRVRRLIAPALILCFTLILAFFLLTRTFITRALVLPRLAAAIGADAAASSVAIHADGTIIIENLRCTAPGVPGEAGVFLEIRRVEAEVSWSGLLGLSSGPDRIRSLTLEKPVFRVSQSIDDGSVNLASLALPKAASTKVTRFPRILAQDGWLELGEHRADQYKALKRLAVDGAVTPAADPEAGGYIVSLRQTGTDPAIDPEFATSSITIIGRLTNDALTLSMRGVSLQDWAPANIPTPLRDLFASLDMQGRIAQANITYPFTGSVSASIDLDGVAMNLPGVTADEAAGPESTVTDAQGPDPMRMTAVSGVITAGVDGVKAQLRGVLVDLPYAVNLDYRGTDANSPFSCELVSDKFEVSTNPQILRFAPEIARERFRNFSNPTGTVSTKVLIERASPENGQPAPISVSGIMFLSNVKAAFQKFPYPVENIEALVKFDDESIVIEDLTGTAVTGATISATARIAPPTSDAGVDVNVRIRGMPMDEVLEAALTPGRRRMITEIFSRDRQRELLDRSLIRRADQPGEAPAFSIGGLADVQVRVTRKEGPGDLWDQFISLEIQNAGILPERFPLPAIARTMRGTIDSTRAVLTADHVQGLNGGTATMRAVAEFADIDDPDKTPLPDIEITATDIPVDALLINAIPDIPGAPAAGGPGTIRGVLRGLNLAGGVNCKAHIGRAESDRLGYQVDVLVPGLSGSVSDSNVILPTITGTVTATHLGVEADLASPLRRAADSGSVEAGSLTIKTASIYAHDDQPTSYTAEIRGTQTDLSAQLEHLVGLVSPGAGQVLTNGRAAYNPLGQVWFEASLLGRAGAPPRTVVTMTRFESLAFQAEGGDVLLGPWQGAVTFTRPGGDDPEQPTHIDISDCRAELFYNGEPAGTLAADGELLFGPGPPPESAQPLHASLDHGHFESALAAAFVRRRLGSDAAAFYDERRPSGLFDLNLTINPDRSLAGTLNPTSLGFMAGEERVEFQSISGAIEFDSSSGRINELRAVAADWSASASGSWRLDGPSGSPGTFEIESDLALDAQGLPPSLYALLPKAVRDAGDALVIKVTGPIHADRIRIAGRWEKLNRVLSVDGALDARGVSAEVGAKVTDADGSVWFTVEAAGPPASPATTTIQARLDSFVAAGLRMTNGQLLVRSGERPGDILVPLISADCHGGRMAGEARITAPRGTDAPREYSSQIRLAGVRFAPLLEDLRARRPEGLATLAEHTDPTDAADSAAHDPAPGSTDESRGTLDAQVSLSGNIGDTASRRGRGVVLIGGERVLKLPLVVPLIKISSLQPPTDEKLDMARATFTIDGAVLSFDELSVFSRSVEIFGYGTVQWPAIDMDLRFTTRSVRSIPLITTIAEGIRNELVTIHVTGPLGQQKITSEQLSSARRLFSQMSGKELSEQERRLEEIRRRATAERDRVRVGESALRRLLGMTPDPE